VTFAGDIFGKKNISGAEYSFYAAADTDLDGSGQCNAPLSARRGVPAVQIVTIRIVFENQRLGRQRRQKMFRLLGLI
jgi:hypothetical protein